MPFPAVLAASVLLALQQGAPSDVPKNHWAYPPVDRMFQEGLLQGYPSGLQPKLALDKSIKQDFKQAEKWFSRWVSLKIIALHHESMRYSERSNYEYAVAAHAVYASIRAAADGIESTTTLEIGRKELPDLARAISMFHAELTKLGANPTEMIAKLNEIESSTNRLFVGNRR